MNSFHYTSCPMDQTKKFYSKSDNDNVVKIWRPSRAEPKPPHGILPSTCSQCIAERAKREPWTPNHGTADEWLDLLTAKSSTIECISWWESVCTILWDAKDDQRLCKAYVSHLANLISNQTWGDKIAKRTEMSFEKLLPADETWFFKKKAQTG